MSEPVERVCQTVDDKELSHKVINGRVMIPALPLRDSYYDNLLKMKKRFRARKTGRALEGSATSKPQEANLRVSAEKEAFYQGEWLPSTSHAAKLVGTLATLEVHQLALEGKVRTLREGGRTLYYRPDVEALKAGRDPPNKKISSSPKFEIHSPEPPRVPSEEDAAKSSGFESRGDDVKSAIGVARMETAREFHGETIEAAISAALEILGVKLEEMDFEVVDPGAKGFLGAGKRDARIRAKAAERSEEKQEADTTENKTAEEDRGPRELASVKETVDLTADEALDSAQAFLLRQGYRHVNRGSTSLSVNRYQPGGTSGGRVFSLLVVALPQLGGGVQLTVEGDDSLGLERRRDKWLEWAEGLPKKGPEKLVDRSTIQAPHKQSGPIEDRGLESDSTYYYTPSQAAEMLGTDIFEVNRLVREGELLAKSIDKHRWLPAKPLEDFVRRKFGAGRLARIPEPRLLGESKEQEPKETERNASGAVLKRYESPAHEKGELSSESRSRYYTVDEVSQKLGKHPHEVWHMAFQRTLQVETVGDQRLFLKEPVDALLGSRKPTASTTGGETTGAPEPMDASPSPSPDDDNYYSAEEAATKLGENVDDLWHMVYMGELGIERVGGQPVFSRGDVDELANRRAGTSEGAESWGTAVEEKRAIDQGDRVRVLEEQLRTEKAAHEQARIEIDQLDAELENRRRDDEDLHAELEYEKTRRAEGERRAEELQADLDEERARSLVEKEELEVRGKGWKEREEYEEQIAALRNELEKERENVRRLEADKHLLDDVRRLLGSTVTEDLPERDKETILENETTNQHAETSEELVLKTLTGQISFLPPFALDKQEEELLRLIAREGELTAEQIRKQTGRRRAHAAFEDLLERLVDEDVRLIVEVTEDRYSFDPTALQND